MKTIIKIICILSIGFSQLAAQTTYRFLVNNLDLPISNSGLLASPAGAVAKYDDIGFLFSGGFFMSGYFSDSIWANGNTSADQVQDYQPGIVGSDPDLPQNKIYVVSADDPPFGQSWQDWKDAVALGADFYDGDGDGIYNPVDKNGNGTWDPNEDKPDIIGDLTAWTVFNDGVPAELRRWQAVPLGIEIQQTLFAFKESNPLVLGTENTVFIRYRIINRGTIADRLHSVYFTLYSDVDIGADFHTDLAGSDSLLFGSYAYKSGTDPLYGDNPPSVFHHFVQFPHAYIPGVTFIDNNNNSIYDHSIDTPLDTAYYHRGIDLGVAEMPGAKNINYATSVFYLRAYNPNIIGPHNITTARNYALGLRLDGSYADPCTFPYANVFGGINCSEINPVHWVSGDPVNNIGWIANTNWDLRILSSAGPFDLNKNEPYEIIVAYTLGRGTDNINSIEVARENVLNTKNAYQNNFGKLPDNDDNEDFIVQDFKLFQNYPNPFNPITKIIWQSPVGSHQVIKVFDVLGREVVTLVDEYISAGSYEVEFDGSSLASGIYFYQLQVGNFITTKKMILIR